MNQELHNKILEDLDKSGFGSEMRAIRAFLTREWRCRGGYHYFDEDANQNKEADLEAWNMDSEDLTEENVLVTALYIIAEVKKTERPWIVFKRDLTHRFETLDAWNNLTYTIHLPFELYHLSGVMSEHSLLGMLGWKGYSIHESFKKPNAPSRWYSAFVSVCKAAEYERAKHAEGAPTQMESWHEFSMVKPVVIVDGPLMAASLNEAGEVSLEEIDFAPFEFAHKSKMSTKNSYRVDVVRLSSMSKYIDLSEQRLNAVKATILSLMKGSPPSK